MAEAQGDDDENDEHEIFVYMGGDQEVPRHVRRARIHISIKIIPESAFYCRYQLISVEFHDKIEIIEEWAFCGCHSLRGCIKLLGVKIVRDSAFFGCSALTDVEFGNKLETIGRQAFWQCFSLRALTMPSVRTIKIGAIGAFYYCGELPDLELPEELEVIEGSTFLHCHKLNRIVLPLRDDMFKYNDVFNQCLQLARVDLVGGIHNTVASLHMESWRNEMMDEINNINQVLPNTDDGQQTGAIQHWMESVIRRLNHSKSEHHKVLKEATTVLELALWKANLDDNEGGEREGV